jgi:valyl-tRNA synthetase
MKILADSYIDKKFGTGAMKCTPAHDFNDNELARKHNITDYVSVINEDGLLNEYANTKYMKLAGVDRIKSRNEIIQNLKSRGFVKKIEEHLNKVGYSERTNEVVEPLLSLQ